LAVWKATRKGEFADFAKQSGVNVGSSFEKGSTRRIKI
jgi:hypothetical protein